MINANSILMTSSNRDTMNWAIAAGVKNWPILARAVRSVEPLTDWQIWASACRGVMSACVAERPLSPPSPCNSMCSSTSPKPDPIALRTTQLPEAIQKANSRSVCFGTPFQSLFRPARINTVGRRLRPLSRPKHRPTHYTPTLSDSQHKVPYFKYLFSFLWTSRRFPEMRPDAAPANPFCQLPGRSGTQCQRHSPARQSSQPRIPLRWSNRAGL